MGNKQRYVKEAKATFNEISYKHKTDNINLSANVTDAGNRIYEELQKWTDNHLTYMEAQLEKIEPLCSR